METTRTFADNHRQRNDAVHHIELLAAIIIGGFGMFLSELGNEINNPIIYWSGMVASISAAGYITMKFLTAFLDFIDRFRKKDNTSK